MKLMMPVIALMLLTVPAHAQSDTAAGKVTFTKGAVTLHQTGRSAPTPLAKGDSVFAGDEIETDGDSAVTITFADKATLSVGAKGSLVIEQYQFSGATPKKVRLQALRAPFEWFGGEKETKDTEIATDFGTISVGEAHLVQGTTAGQSIVYVQGGAAVVKNDGGKVELAAGQTTVIDNKKTKPADAAVPAVEQITVIRTTLPAPHAAWEVIGAAPAPAPEATPLVETMPAAPMEVPPVSAPVEPAPAPTLPPDMAAAPPSGPAPVVTPEPIPVPMPMPMPAPEPIPVPMPIPAPEAPPVTPPTP